MLISLALLPACSTPSTQPRLPASVDVAVAGGIEPVPLVRSAKGQPESEGASGWWATRWSEQDAVGFFGKPAPMTTTHSRSGSITIRYAYYSTEYDTGRHTPVWAAYTIDRSVAEVDLSETRAASNPDFRRPKFFREPLVAVFSRRPGVASAVHETFADAIHPRYPISRTLTAAQAGAKDEILERGHMVPNAAMKGSGTYADGQVSQYQSLHRQHCPAIQRSQRPVLGST